MVSDFLKESSMSLFVMKFCCVYWKEVFKFNNFRLRRSSQRSGAGGLEETYENFTFGEPKDRPASLRLENR